MPPNEVLAAALATGQGRRRRGRARPLDERRRELMTTRDRLPRHRRGADRRRHRRGDCGPGWPSCGRRTRRDRPAGRWRPTSRPPAPSWTPRWPHTSRRSSIARPIARSPQQPRSGWGRSRPGPACSARSSPPPGRTDCRTRAIGLPARVGHDDDLAVKAEADGEEARRATGRVAKLGGELAATEPDTVAAALDDAVRRAESLRQPLRRGRRSAA